MDSVSLGEQAVVFFSFGCIRHNSGVVIMEQVQERTWSCAQARVHAAPALPHITHVALISVPVARAYAIRTGENSLNATDQRKDMGCKRSA